MTNKDMLIKELEKQIEMKQKIINECLVIIKSCSQILDSNNFDCEKDGLGPKMAIDFLRDYNLL